MLIQRDSLELWIDVSEEIQPESERYQTLYQEAEQIIQGKLMENRTQSEDLTPHFISTELTLKARYGVVSFEEAFQFLSWIIGIAAHAPTTWNKFAHHNSQTVEEYEWHGHCEHTGNVRWCQDHRNQKDNKDS